MADAVGKRVRALNNSAPDNDAGFVLYWMQHGQRAEHNPAFERAAGWANKCRLPLLVLFVVDPDYPEANARHYTFMLEGIQETMAATAARGAHFSLRLGRPAVIAAEMARRAAVMVMDRGYLRHLREWRAAVAEQCQCLVEMVEGEVIVPVEAASPKAETAARTIRPKLNRALEGYLDLPPVVPLEVRADRLGSPDDRTLDDIGRFVQDLRYDASVGPIAHTKGGLSHARNRLAAFITGRLGNYGESRSDIVDRHTSVMSPYLHFGQISPLEVLHTVRSAGSNADSTAGYLEEMVVRRELAVNFVHYTPDYDRYESLPGWARASLDLHGQDAREGIYTASELEAGRTDDPYWNAAMREMRVTGYLHNSLRMYWGKRIITYMQDPKSAYETTLMLNNKYFLDGRDANSYTNVSWLYGLHDRGWPERAVYGKVRTMTPSGLRRKFDIDGYVRWANSL